jgi:surface antigen
LILGLAVGPGVAAGAATEILDQHPTAASADTGGYPNWNAPCVANNNGVTQGSGNWCSGYQWGYYTYDSHGKITGNTQNSSRGFGYRNCTDWAAFRAQQLTGILVPYGAAMGDARNWDNNAPSAYTVDNTPEPGDIAVWEATASNSFGHVAVVESVNANNTVNVSEYNRSYDGNYGTRSGVPADHYIDLNGTCKGINGEPFPGGGGSGTPTAPPPSEPMTPVTATSTNAIATPVGRRTSVRSSAMPIGFPLPVIGIAIATGVLVSTIRLQLSSTFVIATRRVVQI